MSSIFFTACPLICPPRGSGPCPVPGLRDPRRVRTFVLFCSLREMSATATKGAATRAAILDRGVDLASAEGLEALSIGRLASELGMSKSGLFAHFGSKQDLQLAIV